MGATGASAFYYDFDSFQEMAITTGGADAQNPTGGVQLNMVLTQGHQHAARRRALVLREREAAGGQHLTGAGGGARQHVGQGQPHRQVRGLRLRPRRPAPERPDLGVGHDGADQHQPADADRRLRQDRFKNYAFKVDGQANNADPRQLHLLREQQDQERPQTPARRRPPETTWNQTGPTKYYKGEGNFVVGSRLFASAKVALRGRRVPARAGRRARHRTTTSTTAAWLTTRFTSTRARGRRTTSAATPTTSPAGTS